MRAIEIIVDQLCRAVNEGKQARSTAPETMKTQGNGEPVRKRSSRAQFSADASAPAAPAGDAPESTPAPTETPSA